ncbi:MAG: hypothetical protein JW779_03145 [Candidatus Thorarchaeota archaeon]|nr:hypothetical protein [Candidatus Thorarchaeota archaeon]
MFNYRIRIIIIIISMIIVFILPYGYHVDLGPGPNGFMSITWECPETESSPIPFSALEYFIYYLYRLVVLNAILKFSHGQMNMKRLIQHGIVGEIIPILISIPGILFLNEEGENYIPIMIPIPFLLLFTLLLALYKYKVRNY